MSCPVCRVPLAMSDRQGIEIDYCPQCRGVWLDRGELDKIIERSLPQSAPQPVQQAPAPTPPSYAPEYRQPWGDSSGHGHYKSHGHYKKRKSWLEEIFD